jgi:hypothetical protein
MKNRCNNKPIECFIKYPKEGIFFVRLYAYFTYLGIKKTFNY